MIVASISDGLGNQMFQYAAAFACAQRLQVPLTLDLRWFEQGKRDYGLDQFPLSARPLPRSDAEAWLPDSIFDHYYTFTPQRWHKRLAHRYWLQIISAGRRRIVTDRKLSKFRTIRDHSYLIGFWQCEPQFRDIRTSILSEFQDRIDLGPAAAAKAKQIGEATTSVAIHIRRGDKAQHAGGVCPAAYYTKAWGHLTERVDRPTPFVFSDDPAQARQVFSEIPSAVFVDDPEVLSAWESFSLMRRCQHFVISNSTFSWWAAWLSEAEGKQVVTPSLWWKSPEQRFTSIGPTEWTQF